MAASSQASAAANAQATPASARRRWTVWAALALLVAVGSAATWAARADSGARRTTVSTVSRAFAPGHAPVTHARRRRSHRPSSTALAPLPPRLAPTLPFPPPRGLRLPSVAEAVPSLYADGLACSVGCRPFGALNGWPLRPFHARHPLRAGLNELRPASLHVGLDIQAPDRAPVFAISAGVARVLAPSGPDARVQVGSYIYWHITPAVRPGQAVIPFRTVLGRVMPGYGHIAFSEVNGGGTYVNPLRPGGRVLVPWSDHLAPVIGRPSVAADGAVVTDAYDPQGYVRRTTYLTPVLAPAALAYRLYDRRGQAVTPLLFAFRGTHLLPWSERRQIYAPGAHSPGFSCFATRRICRPVWRYWVAGGLAPRLPTDLAPGRYRLTVYAWDWADNRSALDTSLTMSAGGWRPRGHVPALPLSLQTLARPVPQLTDGTAIAGTPRAGGTPPSPGALGSAGGAGASAGSGASGGSAAPPDSAP